MQPAFDWNQSFRKSNNNTSEKIILFSFCPNNKTDKTESSSDFMLEKNRKIKNLRKNWLWVKQKKYFLIFRDSKFLPRHGMKVTKLYTVFQLHRIPLDIKVY